MRHPGNFFINSVTPVILFDLREAAGQLVNDATIIGTLKTVESEGQPSVIVAGAENIIFAPSSETGDYVGEVPAGIGLTEDQPYDLFIVATTPAGKSVTVRIRRKAKILVA
jgi:hypothetical protein